ncbi:hypothetical protein D3C76_1160230 [compost metagenome]
MTKPMLSPVEAYRQDLEQRAASENRAREDKERKDKEYLAQHSAKRLVQTSPPYPSAVEALEACHANRQLPGCDYAYVTEDNRVVGIYEYYDVTPDQAVKRGQRRVTIPANF